jgi:Putative peptidoglycan binding domain
MRTALVLAGTLAAIGLSVVPASASNGATPNTADVVCNSVVVLPAQDGSTVSLPGRSGSTDCFLAKGDVSSAVGALQAGLRFCNLRANIAVDDDFGNQTKAAVVNFQKAHPPLTVDGIYGNQTRNAMTWPDNDTLRCTRPTHF